MPCFLFCAFCVARTRLSGSRRLAWGAKTRGERTPLWIVGIGNRISLELSGGRLSWSVTLTLHRNWLGESQPGYRDVNNKAMWSRRGQSMLGCRRERCRNAGKCTSRNQSRLFSKLGRAAAGPAQRQAARRASPLRHGLKRVRVPSWAQLADQACSVADWRMVGGARRWGAKEEIDPCKVGTQYPKETSPGELGRS